MAAVAVVTRTKDRVLLLRRCIETVLNQGFAHWVHVIVNDGGAPDEVEALAAEYRERYGDRLILIHNAESRGMEAAANIGVAASSSELVAVLDDDDTWDPAFLGTCIAALRAETYPGTRGIICRTDIVYERITGTEIRRLRQFAYNADMVAVELQAVLAWNRFSPVSFLFERAVFDEIGLFDESLPVCGDWEFFIRFLLRYEIAVVPQALAFWHQRPEPSSRFGNSVSAGADLHRVVRARLANRWLREAFASGRLTLGEAFIAANAAEYSKVLHDSWWRLRTSAPYRVLMRAYRAVRSLGRY